MGGTGEHDGGGAGPSRALPSGEPRLPDVAVGLAFLAQDLAVVGARRAVRLATPAVELSRWALAAPALAPARRAWSETVEQLAARGHDEQHQVRRNAGDLMDQLTAAVLASPRLSTTVELALAELLQPVLDAALPTVMDQLAEDPSALTGLVDRLIGPILDTALPIALDKLGEDPSALGGLVDGLMAGILDDAIPMAMDSLGKRPELLSDLIAGIIGPVLDTALPAVLDKLEEEPEVVRELVMGQSTGLANDLAGQVRSRTVGADDLVERVARRLTFRKPRPLAGGGPRAIDAASQAVAVAPEVVSPQVVGEVTVEVISDEGGS